MIGEARDLTKAHLLLDYDGTLVPLAQSPELAAPDDELMAILGRLASAPWIELDLASGRARETLETWFGHLPMSLWAEHGFWHRPAPRRSWRSAAAIAPDWMASVLPILEAFAASTPGARIETKHAGIAWHFRGAPSELGACQADALYKVLVDLLRDQPLEVLPGKKVIEVRFRGHNKARVARHRQSEGIERLTIAFGDDRTDEDLFRALPHSSITVAVGQQLIGAKYVVADHRAVRRILQSLLALPLETLS
jgi:trehalose 6-phosphate synthase/phosphatase